MRLLISTTSVMLGLILGPATLTAWTLEPCDSTSVHGKGQAAYRRALETAAPGTSLYTPHVFPKTQEEVVENFLYYHRTALSRAIELPEADRTFFDLIEKKRVRFQMIRVVNWTPLSCGPRKVREFYHLLRAFDRSTGQELLRASVEDNGHVARVRHKPAQGEFPLVPSLLEVGASVHARSGLRPRNIQYVATWGTLRCDEVQPCVAFQDGTENYLVQAPASARVYRLDLASGKLSMRDELAPASRSSRIDALRQAGRELVSLGYDRFTTAVAVSEEP